MENRRARKPVLLVGGVPGNDANHVFEELGKGLGDLPLAFPDGETGLLSGYVIFLAARTYDAHPDLVAARRPRVEAGRPDWFPKDHDDWWQFQVRPGVEKIRFTDLGYASDALVSYGEFVAQRNKGALPADARFQVSLPILEETARWCSKTPRDAKIIYEGVAEAMPREIARICAGIPHKDLVIQWDVAHGTLAVATDDKWGLRVGEEKPMDRYLAQINTLMREVPDDVISGIHLCYGDFNHRHEVEPEDLSVVVDMMNRTVGSAPRTVDYFHVPVPRSRFDHAYFAPLKDLNIGNGKLYLGLVHFTGGIEGTLKRIATAKSHVDKFGIATECGMSRRPRDQTLQALLRIHREAVAAL